MGRGKIEIKKIENPSNRQVTFSKRRGGLLKKAHELGILCDAHIGLIIFSSSGKMFEFCNPPARMREIIDRYLKAHNARIDEQCHEQQLYCELTRMKHENDKLIASIRQFTGEELSALSADDLEQLERQLELSVSKIRNRKHQLLSQQLENLRRKENILEEQNRSLGYALGEHQAAAVMVDPTSSRVHDMPLLDQFGFYHEESKNMLPLSPQFHGLSLQLHPNMQGPTSTLRGHSLQL